MTNRRPSRLGVPAFTLPAVMVVSAAMFILAVGILSIVVIERKTARSFSDAKRAELAARAGLEDFRAVLRAATANDDFLVISGHPSDAAAGDRPPAPYLYVARGNGGDKTLSYRYLPLFSTSTIPSNTSTLSVPDSAENPSVGDAVISGHPWLDPARVEWIPVQDEKGNTVARYAYWVEDLQGKIDLKTAGNDHGENSAHLRAPWPFPAAGITPPSSGGAKLSGVAVHALDPVATEDGDGKLFSRVDAARPLLISPDSTIAATGFSMPQKRTATGSLVDPLAAALERSSSPVTRSYQERQLVPFAPGISAAAAGKPKRNLNALLGKSRGSAVDEFAQWIMTGLPEFENRKGGFPDDYLRTLAANAFDYADTDLEPTVSEANGYRGLDGHPLVSEFAMSFRWQDILHEDGRLYLVLEIGTFVELWNMTNQVVTGEAEVTFESKFSFPVGANPGMDLEELAGDTDVATPAMNEKGGYLWYPPFQVTLQPNEYRVYPSRVVLKVDVGPASGGIASLLDLGNLQQDRDSGYRFRWNGALVDQSRGQMWKAGGQLYYPSTDPKVEKGPRQFSRATIPAHSHSLGALNFGPFQNNMGDPRMAFYLSTPQASSAYPKNYSPNRRNIRWDIYSDDSIKRKYYGRVLPSEWPDGGHNSAFGSSNFISNDVEIAPDDPRFFNNLPTPRVDQAPMRLSNLGRFYSATELGRTYDPVMWQGAYADLSGKPGSGAEDTKTFLGSSEKYPIIPISRTSFPDLAVNSTSSSAYGGGNTLRIGRFEHPLFDRPGMHAAHLLDLFHTGESTSESSAEREGDFTTIAGHVNLNTADADTLRSLVAGTLVQDPLLSQTTSNNHQTSTLMAIPTTPIKLGTPTRSKVADRIAEAILSKRPFASAAEIASARDDESKPVFGNREMYAQNQRIQWADSAAEEVFARLYDASTLRSRNFRVWVVGQVISPQAKGATAAPQVLSESKKTFTVFADPGERLPDGGINPATYRPRVTHENDF